MLKYVILVLALVSCGIATVYKHAENRETFEGWVKSQHPDLFKTIQKRLQKEQEKDDITKYFDRHKKFFDLVRMALRDHPTEISAIMETFLNKMEATGTQISKADDPLICPSRVKCPSGVGSATNLLEMWRKLVKSLLNNDDECDPCLTTFSTFQVMACSNPWEPMRDAAIIACEETFSTIGIDPIICNGTVTLQGQHLYCIAHEATPYEMCEGLNNCYPASESVRIRNMPWELKDNLQPKLQKKLRAKQKRRTRKPKDTLKIIQLSDIHVQPAYAIGSSAQCTAFICCLERDIPRDGSQTARKWGEYSCNLPEHTLRAFLEQVNDFNPDFIVYTGDSPPHTWWDESLNSQINCSNIVVNAIKDIITSGTKVYPNIGNHEMFPTNLYSMRLNDTKTLNQAFTGLWHKLAGLDAGANATFTDMSYYTVLHQPGLRIMCLNTLYDWYNANFYNSLNQHDQFNDDHKNFITTTLSDARANGEKVIILGHHPFGGGSAVLRTTIWWEDVANEYKDVIAMHLSGHTHDDEQHLVIDPNTDIATGINLVTAVATSVPAVNPSLRFFELDSSTFELLNFKTYSFNIDMQHPENQPVVELSYDAKQEYNLPDMSPQAWQDLVLRFIDDDDLFQKWYSNRKAKAQLVPCGYDTCNEECKRTSICNIWFPRIDEAAACVESWGEVTTTAIPETTENPNTGGASKLPPSVITLVIAQVLMVFLSVPQNS